MLKIRDAIDDDMTAISAIYGREVESGFATFEEVAPDASELNKRRQAIVALGLPYLVAEIDGQIVGYSYASTYRPRPAYRYTVENTVYVSDGHRAKGIAGKLLSELISRCERADKRQMIAVIAVVGDHACSASIALHSKLGFRKIGVVEGSGFKHHQWVDTVLMQYPIGDGTSSLPITTS